MTADWHQTEYDESQMNYGYAVPNFLSKVEVYR